MEDVLREIDFNLHLSPEQLREIRTVIAQYAMACLMDSEMAKEAEAICQEEIE